VPPRVMAVAKNRGRPGTTSSGGRTCGTRVVAGAGRTEQPLRPASASEAPISDRNCRLLSPCGQNGACSGYSWRINSWKASLSASSSNVRQYFFPPALPSFSWSSASRGERSLRGFIGGTPSTW
jgi:hypothetical protein